MGRHIAGRLWPRGRRPGHRDRDRGQQGGPWGPGAGHPDPVLRDLSRLRQRQAGLLRRKRNAPPALTDASGAPVLKAMECGAFAEKVLVDQSQIAPLGEDIAPEAACLLACGVPTGVGAVVNTAQVRPGETVVVIGAGGVGLNAIQGARIAGAARIVAMDLEPSKLDDARAFGATDAILASDPKPWKALQEITGGRLADHVFVTV